MKKYKLLSDLDAFGLCIPQACSIIRTVHLVNFLFVPEFKKYKSNRATKQTHLLSTTCLFIFMVGPSSPPPMENSDGRMTNFRTFAALDEEPWKLFFLKFNSLFIYF